MGKQMQMEKSLAEQNLAEIKMPRPSKIIGNGIKG